MKLNVEFEAPAVGLVALTVAAYALVTGFRKLCVEASKLEDTEDSNEEKPE
jgi:hypothetical protein